MDKVSCSPGRQPGAPSTPGSARVVNEAQLMRQHAPVCVHGRGAGGWAEMLTRQRPARSNSAPSAATQSF